ncbi:putative metallopeptidase [Desulfosporosinus sp. PR]|uniref:putative metallopeptidase n=1 Tax=Candidatus Desulfosporosinus nitrosoreducens TaxID=3401928 RepID=UPI0027F3F9E2|nr:putative metallopeptidase [Desulfosporosinus sp. PR]MDQ7095958.1 putative metallopeptidase [Desulfosporosinus sp. PR]
MDEPLICKKCIIKCGDSCAALNELMRTYETLKTKERIEIIGDLRKELDIIDCETADDLKELGEKVIQAMPELNIIKDYGVRIGYVRSYEAKRDKGRQINADCKKVNGTYTAYLPFDFIVTFYEPNVYYMTENQIKILMLHELRHIGIGERGLRLEPHDVEDFQNILSRFGIDWNEFDHEVPDILAEAEVKVGGDGGRKKGTKGNKMEAKHKADSNGRSPFESRGP